MPKSAFTLLCVSLALACAAEDAEPEAPELTGYHIYELAPTWCTGECRVFTLYRDGDQLEIRAYLPDYTYLGRATATLAPEAEAELDGLFDAIDSGEQPLGEAPSGVPFDGALATLWLEGLTLSYTQHYPPTGLTELDELLSELLGDLAECRATEALTPEQACERLATYPE